MRALNLVSSGLSRPVTTLSASADLERAWQALNAAADRYGSTPLGATNDLFSRKDAWVKAMNEYEDARRAVEMAVGRSEGRRGLRVVSNV